MLDWNKIQTVFLDMDGTLLDLHFDNHFWREHVPLRYAQYHGLDVETAKQQLFPRFQAAEGTMDWYCVDYWSQELGIDIEHLKREIDHLISVHPHVVDFIDAARQLGKRLVIVTNAHSKSLNLKMERTQLGGHLDNIICAHDIGLPKEHHEFWQQLQKTEPFEPTSTLLVDDSLPVLKSAQRYGIAHLLAVLKPDSQSPIKDVEGFPAIHGFNDIMPDATR